MVAQYATPVRVADALPGAAVAGTVLATGIDHALVAQRAPPARSASEMAKWVMSFGLKMLFTD